MRLPGHCLLELALQLVVLLLWPQQAQQHHCQVPDDKWVQPSETAQKQA